MLIHSSIQKGELSTFGNFFFLITLKIANLHEIHNYTLGKI